MRSDDLRKGKKIRFPRNGFGPRAREKITGESQVSRAQKRLPLVDHNKHRLRDGQDQYHMLKRGATAKKKPAHTRPGSVRKMASAEQRRARLRE